MRYHHSAGHARPVSGKLQVSKDFAMCEMGAGGLRRFELRDVREHEATISTRLFYDRDTIDGSVTGT